MKILDCLWIFTGIIIDIEYNFRTFTTLRVTILMYNEYSFPFLYPLTDVCWIHNIVNRKFWLMTAIKICEIKLYAINCLSDSVCEKWGDQMIILENSITGLLWLHSIWKAWHQTSVFVFQIKIKFLTKFHFFHSKSLLLVCQINSITFVWRNPA